MKNPPQVSPVSKKTSAPSARELAAKFGIKPLSVEAHRKNLFIARLRYALIALLYFSAGGLCFSAPLRLPSQAKHSSSPLNECAGARVLSEPEPRPWGQPTPLAKWTAIVKRDDPRPFWLRLLLSIRYDFYHKDIRGGATF